MVLLFVEIHLRVGIYLEDFKDNVFLCWEIANSSANLFISFVISASKR